MRVAGPGRTTLAKTNGANPDAVSARPAPLIIVGQLSGDVVGSTNLTTDAVKGTYMVTVASAAGFSPGQIVLLAETSGAGWRTNPQGRGQIWASPDWRVVWHVEGDSVGGHLGECGCEPARSPVFCGHFLYLDLEITLTDQLLQLRILGLELLQIGREVVDVGENI